MAKLKLDDFIDRHQNERIFVLGTGPSLNDLTPEEIKKIETEETSIGVNFSHIQLKPTYWISGGAPCQMAFALEYLPEQTIPFFHQGEDEDRVFPDVEKIVHTYDRVADGRALTKAPKDNTLIGGYNILLCASHLAYVMGASEIVFVGFEQTNFLHFYNLWSKERQENLKDKFRFCQEKYEDIDFGEILGIKGKWHGLSKKIFDPENRNQEHDPSMSHFRSVEDCKSRSGEQAYGYSKNLRHFSKYVNQFYDDGIKILTTSEEGIVVDAGGETITLNKLYNK